MKKKVYKLFEWTGIIIVALGFVLASVYLSERIMDRNEPRKEIIEINIRDLGDEACYCVRKDLIKE